MPKTVRIRHDNEGNSRTEIEGLETPLVGYSHIIGLIAILFIICLISGR